MHEMGIATSILETVEAEMGRRPGAVLHKIGLRIGELSGVDSESLQFCFECLVKETVMESVVLEINRRPQRNRCPDCDMEFPVSDFKIDCPRCGRPDTRFVGGDELEVAYLELEEP